jgi:hypothetical protein
MECVVVAVMGKHKSHHSTVSTIKSLCLIIDSLAKLNRNAIKLKRSVNVWYVRTAKGRQVVCG